LGGDDIVKTNDSTRREFLKESTVGAALAAFSAFELGKATSGEEGIELARGGEPQASIVIGEENRPFYRWLAEELQRHVRQISGAELPIESAGGDSSKKAQIVIGGPQVNERVADAQRRKLVDFTGLKGDGFLLQQMTLQEKPTLVVGGNSEASTMYSVYELIERLGVVFQITGDIIPDRKDPLIVPPLQVRMEPALKYRGLHIRQFVLPWMGVDDFRGLLDQMAKMKCNYLEFFWYVGGPWVEYSYKGEKKLIGDVYTRESGYLTWRANTATFEVKDVEIGREHFAGLKRACAPEFQEVETPADAYQVARDVLHQIIEHAHQRRIQVWLGMGDCPWVCPTLASTGVGQHASALFGVAVSPGDPRGLEIWQTKVNAAIESYPEADGFWVWLAESYLDSSDAATTEFLRRYDQYRNLIPNLEEIHKMGYDLPTTEGEIQSDVALLHYGTELARSVRLQHPAVHFGIAVLGRAYLFPAMDSLIPKGVAFSSMESSAVWNRSSKVPMHLFGNLGDRETFLIPRLDDDGTEFGMQFNVGLYHHDEVFEESVRHGVAGVIPQTGMLRGVEQNAKFLTEGAWKPSLAPVEFYQEYSARIFGRSAAATIEKAFNTLEAFEKSLGWGGLGNFHNYADTQDISMLKRFGSQANLFEGPMFPRWNVREKAESPWIQDCNDRRSRYLHSIEMLRESLDYLQCARKETLPGAQKELEYLMFRVESYTSHLQMICALLSFYIAYDNAFRAKYRHDFENMLGQFDVCESQFSQVRELVRKTALQVAGGACHPNDVYILFRYNVRLVLPINEFSKVVANVVNFHRGRPYWEKVNWDVIAPRNWMNV
jgi:hypothetical protein